MLDVAALLAKQISGKTTEAEISDEIVHDALQKRILLYDKTGEEHYNLISALHKSVRNSDPDASLYWLGRMLEAGEDPLYIARRVVRMAVEDVGLADPDAQPFSRGKLTNPYGRLLAFTGVPAAGALTVNEITTDPGRIAWYRQNSNAMLESMEGAPLHYVCLRESIPFLQLRSVSNTVGVRDKTKWDIPLAISRLNEHLTRILGQLASADPSILQPSNYPS